MAVGEANPVSRSARSTPSCAAPRAAPPPRTHAVGMFFRRRGEMTRFKLAADYRGAVLTGLLRTSPAPRSGRAGGHGLRIARRCRADPRTAFEGRVPRVVVGFEIGPSLRLSPQDQRASKAALGLLRGAQ